MSGGSISRSVLAAVVVIVVVTAVLGALAAYRLRGPSVTLTVATYTGAPAQPLLELAAEEFMKEHPGVKVNVVAYPFSQYITNELTVLQSRSPEYDVVTYTTTTVGEVAPYLLQLNSSAVNATDILKPDLDAAGLYYNPSNGSVEWVGVPIQTDGLVIIYNTKYFDNATLQQEFYDEYHAQLNPWTWHNWSVVVDVSQFFVQHNITKYGVLAFTDQGDLLDNTFLPIFGYFYINNATLNCGNPMGVVSFGTLFYGCPAAGARYPMPAVNSSAGVQALELLRQLVSYMPNPTQLQVTFDNELELLLQNGTAPAAVGYIGEMPDLVQSRANASQFAIAPLPGSTIRIGLTYIGVSKYSAHKRLALEFLQLVESPQFQELAFTSAYVFPSTRGAYELIISNSSLPAYLREWAQAALAAANTSAIVAPYFPSITSSVVNQAGEYIFNYVTSAQQSPQAAAQEVAGVLARAVEAYYQGSPS